VAGTDAELYGVSFLFYLLLFLFAWFHLQFIDIVFV